jgi:hypothetical protein
VNREFDEDILLGAEAIVALPVEDTLQADDDDDEAWVQRTTRVRSRARVLSEDALEESDVDVREALRRILSLRWN